MNTQKKGRKAKYTDEQLIAIVIQYANQHPGEKVSIDQIMQNTGVSRATLYRSEAVRKKINQLNGVSAAVNMGPTELPTLSDIAKECGSDPIKYQNVIGRLLDIISTQQSEMQEEKARNSAQIKAETEDLRHKLSDAEALAMKLSIKLNAAINGQDKLINLGDNIEKMDKETFDAQFGDLFDD